MDSKDRLVIARNLISLQEHFGVGTQKAYDVYKAILKADVLDKDIRLFVDKIDACKQHKLILSDLSYDFALKTLQSISECGIELMLASDPHFPERLRNIPQPPLVIYYKGEFPEIDSLPAVTIVGPRKATEFGRKSAYALGYRLSKAGFVVISGGALGCDSYAHIGALKAGGKTVAVLGCGLESNYLKKNKELRRNIASSGCVISEYPPFKNANKYTFPVRNRLMSALGLGTVVVEAGPKSGALITAGHAIEQGKEVFVIPGNPTLSCYKGSNSLLRDGAIPLLDASDIFNSYITEYADKIDIEKAFQKQANEKKSSAFTDETNNKTKKYPETLSKEAKIVYNYTDKQNFTADDLLGCGLSYDEILSALTELEMEMCIKALPGGAYDKIPI